MKFHLRPEIFEQLPGLYVSVIVAHNIQNSRRKSMISQLLRGAEAERKRDLANPVKKEKIFAMLDSFDFKNKKLLEVYVLDQTLKKIAKGKNVEEKNNFYSLLNYISLKNILPLFGADLDTTEKDFTIDLFEPKKGRKTPDIEATKETKNVVFWFFNIHSLSREDFILLSDEVAKVIDKYLESSQIDYYLLDADHQNCDLKYTSTRELEYQEQMTEPSAEDIEEEEIELFESFEPPIPATPTQSPESAPQVSEAITAPEINSETKSGNKKAATKSPKVKTVPKEKELPSFLEHPTETPVMSSKLTSEILQEKFFNATNTLLSEKGLPLLENKSEIIIDIPKDQSHGDYTTNIAMKLAKKYNENPQDFAAEVIKKLELTADIEKTEIAGPGFINCTLSLKYLQQELQQILSYRANYGRLNIGQNQTVLVEYSSPNIAKPLGVHHLLSTLIGQSIADMMSFGGYKVTKLNYLGDWGTQFGKLIYAYRHWGDQEQVQVDPLNELLKLYVKFHDEAEKDPSLDEQGRAEFKKLEEGDSENQKLWEWMRELSIKELKRLYTKLGVHFDEFLGEQMYLNQAKQLIAEGEDKKIITTGENNALIVSFPEEKYPPYLLQKSDGTTLYSTRDLASIQDRIKRYHPMKLIYVVDVAQTLHFNQLFETAKLFHLSDERTELKHVIFGRMQMPEGKMSTRKGEIILVDELINEGHKRATELLNEKSKDLTPEEQEQISGNLAISAIKYSILSQNRETNITFSWDKILTFEGNSCPFIQYTCARAKSILRKSEETPIEKEEKTVKKSFNQNDRQTSLFSLTDEEEEPEIQAETEVESGAPFSHPTEQTLLRELGKFPEVIQNSIENYKPNLITNYLFELSKSFNAFYNDVSVLNTSNPELRESRLKIVDAVNVVLSNGLKLLGLTVFEKM